MKIPSTSFIQSSPRPGKVLTRFADAELGGLKNLVVGQTELQPETFVPAGRHDVEEVYIVLNGLATIQVGDQTFEAGKGDVVIVPPGAEHRVQNHGDAECSYLWIASPQP